MYSIDRFSIKPLSIGTMKIKLLGLSYVLIQIFYTFLNYEGTCNLLLSFNNKGIILSCLIKKMKIKRSYNNNVEMNRGEDEN